MPAGYTAKRSLTPYRRELLEWVAREPRPHLDALEAAARHQVGEMVRFGWLEWSASRCRITDAGRAALTAN